MVRKRCLQGMQPHYTSTHVKEVTAGGAANLRLPVTSPLIDACTANSRVPGPEPAMHSTHSVADISASIAARLLHVVCHAK